MGKPQQLEAAFVTPGFYATFGMPPIAGGVPRDDEMVRGANDRRGVLSYWIPAQRAAGKDAALALRHD